MNTWSQQEQEELHESSANRLYECKPVKSTKGIILELYNAHILRRLTALMDDDMMSGFFDN